MGEASDDEIVLRWSRHPRQIGLARAELRTALMSWSLASLADSAALVLSELLTNAVQHARVPSGREIETRFVRLTRGVRIEVHDASPLWPVQHQPADDACDGRGLLLVAALADSWGFGERRGPGKVVWAECVQNGGGVPA